MAADTKDESLRVAREALEGTVKVLELATAGYRGVRHEYILTRMGSVVRATDVIDRARSALRTIALAVEAPSLHEPSERDAFLKWARANLADGQVRNIEEAMQRGESVSFDIWQAARGVQSVALGEPKALAADEETVRAAIEAAQLTPNRDMDAYEALARLVTRASASGAVGETAALTPDEIDQVIKHLELGGHGYASKDYEPECPVCTATEKLKAKLAAGLPGTSNGQEIGNG